MKTIEFASLKIKRATDVIENRISGMIINGNINPGEKLPTEKELSEQFDVSTVTVREALRGLEVAGMIQKRRGKGGGIYVTEIGDESIMKTLLNFLKRRNFSAQHLAEVRLLIEPTLVRMVATNISSSTLDALDTNLNFCEMKLFKAESSITLGDYRKIGEKNLAFHKLIAESTENPILVLTMDYVLDFISDFKTIMFTPDQKFSTKIVKDHRQIYTALKEANAGQAESRMLEHLKYLEKYQMDERF